MGGFLLDDFELVRENIPADDYRTDPRKKQ
jgi:hypothetical protein